MEGQPETGAVSKLTEVHQGYKSLLQDIQEFQLQRSDIENVDKFLRRISRDLVTIENAISKIDPSLGAGGEERANSLVQGFSNNLAGFKAEYHVARTAPDVVAFSKKFQALVQDQGEGSGIAGKMSKSQCKFGKRKTISVEVDVVAESGHVWIEVKSHKCTDLESIEWLGVPGHAKGLQCQIADYLWVARSPNNYRRWQAPKVAIHVLGGCSEPVKHAIQQMGAYVLDAHGLLSLRDVPRPPLPPVIVNLDVTSMCALVSEVCHGGPENDAVCEWAQRVCHWEECLQHERTDPLLPNLKSHLGDKPLVAAEKAVLQFELLLEKFSGLSEASRWRKLKETIKIYEEKESHLWLSKRVSILDIPEVQQHVFGLGDHLHALTVTANGRAVNKLDHEGVHLECFVHRAVWLTGL